MKRLGFELHQITSEIKNVEHLCQLKTPNYFRGLQFEVLNCDVFEIYVSGRVSAWKSLRWWQEESLTAKSKVVAHSTVKFWQTKFDRVKPIRWNLECMRESYMNVTSFTHSALMTWYIQWLKLLTIWRYTWTKKTALISSMPHRLLSVTSKSLSDLN